MFRDGAGRPGVGVLGDVAGPATVVTVVSGDRRRPIGVAQLDLEVGDEGLVIGGLEVRRGAGHVAGVGLLDGQPADRAPLGS